MKVLNKYLLMIAVLLLFLTGCMYPQERLSKNQVPYESQLQAVQLAVDAFQQDNNGLLPIRTRESDTPVYLKYPIDFNRLTPKYIQDAPGSAYESGGIYQFVLTDVENDPTVKVIDLVSIDNIRDLKLRLMIYRDKEKYPPFKEEIGSGVYSLDFAKLGYDTAPFVRSPYSGNHLPLVTDGTGEIYIDYASDLYEALNNYEHDYKYGDDIRQLLVENYPVLPAYSLPYTVENGEPVFLKQ
ncbi:hypothetical protein [Bacillus solimangrovi]|uniref:ABC transporter periplasmic binding protein yphF n=1 Tax=Bacillus solimangrovi TaxID=1305675 RepID=A0A1E5LHA8_9BACI|nr:hypothetical protein [Bacillus solimangrovi]OEH93463.1 hypothetical protein BFG57_00260 [Bacillus solimangrovi]